MSIRIEGSNFAPVKEFNLFLELLDLTIKESKDEKVALLEQKITDVINRVRKEADAQDPDAKLYINGLTMSLQFLKEIFGEQKKK